MRKSVVSLIVGFLFIWGAAGGLCADHYPPDPETDYAWSAEFSGVADIKSVFDAARQHENRELDTAIPELVMPSQDVWDAFSDGEKALWLINAERRDRGLMPLTGLESHVGGIAQYYADYLLEHDAWGHEEDGHNPWERLNTDPAISACHDFLGVAENLAVFVSTGSIPMPIERSVYMWMYNDGSCCSWGHRHAILWYPYNDNSGVSGKEGFLGIGRASGGPYQGPFSSSWQNAEIIVMNVFDPCSSWNDSFFYVSRDAACSGHSPCYTAIDDAYRDVVSYRQILIRAEYHLENLLLDRSVDVVLSGGWDNDYTGNRNAWSTVAGSLTISSGTVVIENLILEAPSTLAGLPSFLSAID